MSFDPIDRTWISGGFQPSVHSDTASSTIFYLYMMGLENYLFYFLKIPRFYLLQDVYICPSVYTSVDIVVLAA